MREEHGARRLNERRRMSEKCGGEEGVGGGEVSWFCLFLFLC